MQHAVLDEQHETDLVKGKMAALTQRRIMSRRYATLCRTEVEVV
jgi:hypothetical protein